MQTTPSEKLIISKLKFIASIEIGKRVNLYNYTLIDDNILNNILRRFVYNDSRWHTLRFIDNTVSNAFEIARKYSRREDIQDKTLVNRIIEDIAASIRGIENLCQTYKNDRKFVADVQIIRDSIPAMISDFKISLQKTVNPEDLLSTLLEINKICERDEISGIVFGDEPNVRPSTPILVESIQDTSTIRSNADGNVSKKKKKGK